MIVKKWKIIHSSKIVQSTKLKLLKKHISAFQKGVVFCFMAHEISQYSTVLLPTCSERETVMRDLQLYMQIRNFCIKSCTSAFELKANLLLYVMYLLLSRLNCVCEIEVAKQRSM